MNSSKVSDYLHLLRLRNYARVYAYQALFFLVAFLVIDSRSPALLLLIMPYLLASMAGYVHNNIVDSSSDTIAKNPLTARKISPAVAYLLCGLLLVASIISFALVTALSVWFHVAYLALWFFYNQKVLGFRLKESIIGPVAAALILEAYYPALLLTGLNGNGPAVILMLFSYGVSAEMGHTIKDRSEDLRKKIKTFGVRVTPRVANVLALMMYLVALALFIMIFHSLIGVFFVLLVLALAAINGLLTIRIVSRINYGLYRLFAAFLLIAAAMLAWNLPDPMLRFSLIVALFPFYQLYTI